MDGITIMALVTAALALVALAVLARLEEKGVFDMRDAVPQVCELLQISQATLYNYQRELRGEQKKRGAKT